MKKKRLSQPDKFKTFIKKILDKSWRDIHQNNIDIS